MRHREAGSAKAPLALAKVKPELDRVVLELPEAAHRRRDGTANGGLSSGSGIQSAAPIASDVAVQVPIPSSMAYDNIRRSEQVKFLSMKLAEDFTDKRRRMYSCKLGLPPGAIKALVDQMRPYIDESEPLVPLASGSAAASIDQSTKIWQIVDKINVAQNVFFSVTMPNPSAAKRLFRGELETAHCGIQVHQLQHFKWYSSESADGMYPPSRFATRCSTSEGTLHTLRIYTIRNRASLTRCGTSICLVHISVELYRQAAAFQGRTGLNPAISRV